MAVPDEKSTNLLEEADSLKGSTLDTPSLDNVANSDKAHLDVPPPPPSDDQYPHGMKLVILAGASLVAIFLIALDQVCTPLMI